MTLIVSLATLQKTLLLCYKSWQGRVLLQSFRLITSLTWLQNIIITTFRSESQVYCPRYNIRVWEDLRCAPSHSTSNSTTLDTKSHCVCPLIFTTLHPSAASLSFSLSHPRSNTFRPGN